MVTANLTSVEKLQQAFSLAAEDRAKGWVDLISNSNVFYHELEKRGLWEETSGPTIRQRLAFAETGSYTRISGYQFLNPQPQDQFNDAEFEWKLAFGSMTASGEEILKNSGKNQLVDLVTSKMELLENEIRDRWTEDLHSAGLLTNQMGGLQQMVPTTTNSGTYGGISRVDNAIWRTTTYNANSITVAGASITAVTSTTIRPLLNHLIINHTRGKDGMDLFLMSGQHYQAFDASVLPIQRINDENAYGKQGFQSLVYFGAGRRVSIVLEGGIGSAMPSDVTYGLRMDDFAVKYHPDLKFAPIGGKQMPINQYAIAQHVGIAANVIMKSPLHNAKLYDSSP
jgi:hypothetical protein